MSAPFHQIHGAVLDLLLEVCKQLQPEVLAGYLGTLLETTADSRTKREGLREEYNRITVPHTGGGLDTIPGEDLVVVGGVVILIVRVVVRLACICTVYVDVTSLCVSCDIAGYVSFGSSSSRLE